MGGSIAITLITPEGQTYKMGRWTNSFPGFINNLKFIQKDDIHIEEYLESWLEMKKDWNENGPDGPFEHNMTPIYLPYEQMAPMGYGLVVIDMQRNKIYHCQGYSSLGSVFFTERMKKFNEENYDAIQILKKHGRLSHCEKWGPGSDLYKVDLSPFVVHKYEESFAGFTEMMKDLRKEYFLSDEELKTWMSYIKDIEDEEC